MAKFRASIQFDFKSKRSLKELADKLVPVIELCDNGFEYLDILNFLTFEIEELDYPEVDIEKL